MKSLKSLLASEVEPEGRRAPALPLRLNNEMSL
jgi:hypothetical protein